MRGANLPNTKRSEKQRENDRSEIARLLARGTSLREIRDTLNASRSYKLSLTQICKDAARVRRDFRAVLERRQDDHLAETLAVIRAVECEAWQSWEASKQERKRRITVKRGAKIFSTSAITESSNGDSCWLALILDCVDRRCKLLGLHAPTCNEVSVQDAAPLSVEFQAALELVYGSQGESKSIIHSEQPCD